LFSKL